MLQDLIESGGGLEERLRLLSPPELEGHRSGKLFSTYDSIPKAEGLEILRQGSKGFPIPEPACIPLRGRAL